MSSLNDIYSNEDLILFKKLMNQLYNSNNLPDFFKQYIYLVRNILEVLPECYEYDEKGHPIDWVECKCIDNKLREKNISFRKGLPSKIILSMLPDVVSKKKIFSRLTGKSGKYMPDFKLSYEHFKQRRTNGRNFIYIRPQWVEKWKEIYTPSNGENFTLLKSDFS